MHYAIYDHSLIHYKKVFNAINYKITTGET